MQCSKCRQKAIHYQPYSGQYLCVEHLVADIETKAKRTIRQQKGMCPGDHIAVIITGDPAERALLFFLHNLAGKRRDILVSGIPGGAHESPDSIAGRTGATRIALATTLEDCSAAILAGILRGEPMTSIIGRRGDTGTRPVFAPFCHIPSCEIAQYSRIHGLEESSVPAARQNDSLYEDVKNILGAYAHRHPAAPHAILNLGEMLSAAAQETEAEQNKHRTVDEETR
ncbi:adenine nucleotide alpha hydrolase family protein [Methanoregula formicica]|uniref:2-thiouridine synthetase TtuA-like N-terminal LIM domain-containing protein n=1 Tax=Methanoregula formicica (strain DSM 22288 / NBRC 105244 / SMSP) TaxID=593750 RepID=L0HDL0_METFS|nr:hypothetical protein [Methanoregula formicica]AGB01413.1 hypothetical protein Metfor_0336 [Methanoregula formicica SMSP]